jgi:predicted amidohydrolase YtcJ
LVHRHCFLASPGGIAVQNRMAFQGEYFVERYGAQQAKRTPPIRRMLEMGVPVGARTDATRDTCTENL